MKISMIVAMSENLVIGKDGKMPWRISSDLKRFKNMTTGKIVVMGRLTYESIGKILPNRTNIILSSNKEYNVAGAIVLNSVEEVLKFCKDETEIFIIGGNNIYKLFENFADYIYVTKIKAVLDGDTFFTIDLEKWDLLSTVKVEREEKDEYETDFLFYNRVSKKNDNRRI